MTFAPTRGATFPQVNDLSLRTWEPVFSSLHREVLGDEIGLRLHPDWKVGKADGVADSCTNEERVAVVDDPPVGFVTIALNAFTSVWASPTSLGSTRITIARGIASELTAFDLDHMRRIGMDIGVEETGGDPGHAPARATFEAMGFTRPPIAR